MMAIDNTGAAYERMKTWLFTGNPVREHFTLERFFTEPSVYDWHKPSRHSEGYFRLHHDPYEWFDPITGVPASSEESDGWQDMADALSYGLAGWKRTYLNEWPSKA